ncbi:SUKH-3 domain-containing protein [Dactylosporangium siamense]|uniref:SUKH-3 domain containing protein n=1 Tax=Dactylosporangium siamense TaxID=685454 RepID=A0A919PSA4_9ACTN|nr:SUKH-3 domain-containing protein [Dactylosporangium siamense]GIG49965.1 hypothetical protein Dsi01nite_080060 [Dactylosporangium siamense]
MNLPTGLSQQTRQVLAAAGWHVGRKVDTACWEAELTADGFPEIHLAARRFLAEFGGLTVADGGAGVTRAREPFTLRPTDCLGEADRFIEWGEHTGRNLAPIGELAGNSCACAWLGMDEYEEIYVVVDELATFGRMPLAMEHLALGYMPRRIN